MTNGTQRLYLPPRECARRCGVSSSTIYRWISQGRIPSAIKTLGNHNRIPEQAIVALMEAGTKNSKKGNNRNDDESISTPTPE